MKTQTYQLSDFSPQQKLAIARLQLQREFYERETLIDAMLALAIVRQHGILLGPPGTAKSDLIRWVAKVMGGKSFSVLMSPQTKYEDLFGVVDIPSMRDKGIYKRNNRGSATDANYAFIDEIYKTDGSMLNPLLTLINERIYKNPDEQKAPLRSAFGASNELPVDDVGAFNDRFTYVTWINRLTESNWIKLMEREADRDEGIIPSKQEMFKNLIWMNIAETEQVEALVKKSQNLYVGRKRPLLLHIYFKLLAQNLCDVSERKSLWINRFLTAVAYVQGKTSVDNEIIQTFLPDAVNINPDNRDDVVRVINEAIAQFKTPDDELEELEQAASKQYLDIVNELLKILENSSITEQEAKDKTNTFYDSLDAKARNKRKCDKKLKKRVRAAIADYKAKAEQAITNYQVAKMKSELSQKIQDFKTIDLRNLSLESKKFIQQSAIDIKGWADYSDAFMEKLKQLKALDDEEIHKSKLQEIFSEAIAIDQATRQKLCDRAHEMFNQTSSIN